MNNREIKFRVWDIYEKKFLNYDCWFNHRNFYEFTCFERLFNTKDEKIIIQQYTGLKDKNGKEIYEGDIVRGVFFERPDYVAEGGIIFYNGSFTLGNKNMWEYSEFEIISIFGEESKPTEGLIRSKLSRYPTERKELMNKKELIYLASPYSHDDPYIKENRFNWVCKTAAKLMSDGYFILSPIAHTHPIAIKGDLPGEWSYWSEYDRLLIKSCKLVLVLKIDGWEKSTGVQAEIKIAEELGIPVEYMEFDKTLI